MEVAFRVGFGFLAYGILRLAGVPIEVFIALIIAVVIGWPIGWFVGTLVGDETDVDTPKFKAIGWANLIAWLIPIAGVAVAALSSSLGKESINHRFFYEAMSWVGHVLVIACIALSVPLMISDETDCGERLCTQQQDHVSSASTVFGDHNSDNEPAIRSFARCPYAALENWSDEEIQEHCNKEPTEAELREFQLEQERAKNRQR